MVFNSGKIIGNTPGSEICFTPQATCTNGDDPEADSAYQLILDTYQFYWEHYQRNGMDNAGTIILASVHSADTTNAFWDGRELAFADGYAKADDVVAHELTHDVVETEVEVPVALER